MYVDLAFFGLTTLTKFHFSERWMRQFILILGLCFTMGLFGPAQAQNVFPPNPDIESTLTRQLDAFAERDVEDAWRYASPNIQNAFRTPDNFGRMVEQGYPMVWTPGQVRFIDLQGLGSIIVQRVEVMDQTGRAHILGYQMIETETGWRINAVRILEIPMIGA